MANTMFRATFNASNEITRTFDMVWALDAGLWCLRCDTNEYLVTNPDASNDEIKDKLINGISIHGINFKRIAQEYSWDEEEQYIAQLLLINAMSIYDAWVDDIVDASFPTLSNNRKKDIKKKMKEGDFSELDTEIYNTPISTLSDCFHISYNRQDAYIDKLILVYKYFKSCRNCCAHGSKVFTNITATNYNALSGFTKTDLGTNEFPKIENTISGSPFKLYLRGVVELYDILIRIIQHYDIVLSEHICIEQELNIRWKSQYGDNKKVSKSRVSKNHYISHLLSVINMPPTKGTRNLDVIKYLERERLIKITLM